MLRIPSLFYLQIRNVRAKVPVHARPPYPFFHKRDRGWREEGPYFDEAWLWPERSSGWSVVPSWFPNKPEPSFVDDALSQKTGYPDPQTDKWVEVEDAKPELIVPPDLDNFKLKPYVSFRTPETEADAPPLTAKDLFDVFYTDRIETAFKQGVYDKENIDSILEKEIGDEESRKKKLVEKGLPFLDDGVPRRS